jgi:hypothetical protein
MVQNGTQIRGIHQGLLIYAPGNNQWFTGLNRTGGYDVNNANWLLGPPQETSIQAEGGAPSYRLRRLAELNFFAGNYMIAPIEEKKVWSAGPMFYKNYSYGLLEMRSQQLQRKAEWRATNNAEAVVIGDRLVHNPNNNALFQSIWVSPPRGVQLTEWRGNVGWNDNHVTVEDDMLLTTTYGSSRQARHHTSDNIFIEESALGRRSDAWLVHTRYDFAD